MEKMRLLLAITSVLSLLQAAQAEVTTLRATSFRSIAGFADWSDAINNCSGGTTCVGQCNMTSAGPQACQLALLTRCQKTTSGDMCVLEVELEVDLTSEPTTSNPARMVVQAHPVIMIRRVSGPTTQPKVSGQPWRARWRYELSTALAEGWNDWDRPTATFVATQGSQMRAVSLSVFMGCQSAAVTSVAFNDPQVDCKTGRLEATARVTGCPDLFHPGDLQNAYLDVFNGSIAGSVVTDFVSALTNLYPTFDERGTEWKTISSTGPGAIKAVFLRKWGINWWPEGTTSIKLGYRYIARYEQNDSGEQVPVWDPPQEQQLGTSSTYKLTGRVSVVPCK